MKGKEKCGSRTLAGGATRPMFEGEVRTSDVTNETEGARRVNLRRLGGVRPAYIVVQ